MTAEATLPPTTKAGGKALGIIEQGVNPRWQGLAAYGNSVSRYAASIVVAIEREAAAAAMERINDQWDALIAQRVAGNITDLGVIQAMNGIFDATPLQDPDPRLTEQESRP